MQVTEPEVSLAYANLSAKSEEDLFFKAIPAMEADPSSPALNSSDWKSEAKKLAKRFSNFASQAGTDGLDLLAQLRKPDLVTDVQLVTAVAAFIVSRFLINTDFPIDSAVAMALLIIRTLPQVD